jgi:two-component system, NtrC family, nitrogen regulation sensor histidine kinase NtrY
LSSLRPKRRWPLALAAVFLTLLLAAIFTFGSLDVRPGSENWRAALDLFAVSAFITAACLVFLLILFRTVLRLWTEHSKEQLGARFKTKMVVGAMALSLLPVLFMSFVSYSLLNRTLGRWFPRPLEIASEQSQNLFNDLGRTTAPRLRNLAREAQRSSSLPLDQILKQSFLSGVDALWFLDASGKAVRGGIICQDQAEDRTLQICDRVGVLGARSLTLPSGIEVWEAQGQSYLVGRVAAKDSSDGVAAGYRVGPAFLAHIKEIQARRLEYEAEKQSLRALKTQMLLILAFFTILLLFSLMWIALFLAKQVTVPIQALAEGTREVSLGNFDYQVPEQAAHDELGIFIRSFNAMTTQLRDSRAQIDQFTRNLQQAVQELERRRQLMETILENIPTGVISLDSTGSILRENSAVTRIFGESRGAPQSLEHLLGPEGSRTVLLLMRRSLRLGVASREIETIVSGRVLHLAVTVSSLGPRRANTGFVLVLDDLTEMLRSQKSAAWQEVARRIAHEIKNPLTPIQLSSQRLSRFLDRRDTAEVAAPRDPELTRLTQECSRLIEREVATLAALVNEFSQFVRFPIAKLAVTNPNTVVHEAVEVFSGRLDGISLKTSLADGLPSVRADGGLLRSVVVNLIDNAAEALETAQVREITVSTCAHGDAETVEICVQDTGHGISPEDKDRLFLPHFSTKNRGTGLGLAIAARIVAEHGGTIRVEDNFPIGSRFLVELPGADNTPVLPADRAAVETS